MNPHRSWLEQCEAAKTIQDEFGTDRALAYLIGEKFVNFLGAAETDEAFREEIPAFVDEIRRIFERWQLAAYLETARQTEPFDPSDYGDPAEAEFERRLELRESANELLLVERAREWLLEE
jgi:5'-deoxynucleotidase YfbR-like HD superfamily hydrolase